MQPAAVGAPAALPYRPTAHPVQADVPVASAEYAPVAHAVHAEVPVASAL